MSILFDGDDYIEGGDLFYSDALTFHFRIKPKLIDVNPRSIMVKRNTNINPSPNEWAITYDSTKLNFIAWNQSQTTCVDISSKNPLKLNNETHVVIIVPAMGHGNPSIYINGVLDNTGIRNSAIIKSISSIQIGTRTSSNNNRYLNGELRDVAVWNKAIASSFVPTLYTGNKNTVLSVELSNLQFYLPLDEGTIDTTANGKQLADISNAKRKFIGNYGINKTGLLFKANPAPIVNKAPIVNAGVDKNSTDLYANPLNGSVSDDNLPTGSKIVTGWTFVSGPGSVSFADAKSLNTTVDVPTSGIYILRLIASDGVLASYNDMKLTVQIPSQPLPPPSPTPTPPTAEELLERLREILGL